MMTLDKEFYRKDGDSNRRELEKYFDMFSLNETQKQKLREIVDKILEAQRREYTAPERKPTIEENN